MTTATPGMAGRAVRPMPQLERPRHLANAWIGRSNPGPQPGLFTAAKVEIQFNGTDWEDVSDRMTAAPITCRYGRATEFDDVTPGVFHVQLYNGDGALMPDNPDSPYSPNVVEDKKIRFSVFRGLRQWSRFTGWIRSIEPTFPTSSTTGAVVNIAAVDNLGVLALYPLISQWLSGVRYEAGLSGARWDGFVMLGDGEASSTLDNVTDSPGNKATAAIVAATSNKGTLRFAKAEGLSIEGSVQLTPASTNVGAVIRVDTPNQIRAVQFWLRLPGQAQVSAALPQLDLVVFRDALDGNLGSIRLTNNAGLQDVGFFNAAGAFVTQLAFNAADERWLRVTLSTDTATPTTTDMNWDGGSLLNNMALDLRNVRTMWFGGKGALVPKVEFAGIALYGSELNLLPASYGQTGSTAGGTETLGSRVAWLQQRVPVLPFVVSGGDYSRLTCIGNWHDRTALEVCNEIARTGNGFTFARPRDSTVLVVPRNLTYPTSPVLVVDAEGDLIGAPKLRRAVDSRPTQVVVNYPGGTATVVDKAAETAAQGQSRSRSVTTIAASLATATDVGEEVLLRGGLGLRITEMSVDLETGTTDPVPALFEDRTSMGGLFPSQMLRVVLPASHFGAANTRDVHVEGWTEVYDPVGGCRIDFDLSPSVPPVTGEAFEVASSSSAFVDGPTASGTVTVPRPTGVRAGELLIAVHLTDNDGSLATMTAPAGWVQRSSASSSAGFGKIWTLTAGTSEPGEYVFGTDTDAMGHVTLLRVTGADTSNPLYAGTTWSNVAVAMSSHVAASITPTGDALLICGFMFVFGPPSATTWTLPGGMTAQGPLVQPGTYMQAIVASEPVVSGATGTRTATSSISSSALGNLRVAFAVRPAP